MKTTLVKVLAHLGFSGNTRLAPADPRSQSWARLARSYEEVPNVYRAFLDALPANEASPFPYTLLTPTFKGIYGKPEHERLVCAAGSHIHVLERIENRFASTSYHIDNISYVECGVILLYAWITIHGLADSGLVSSTTFAFNTVTDHIMYPLIVRMRSAQGYATVVDHGADRPRLSYLADLNFKFMSYGERSLLPGENVVQIIYQPEIRREVLGALGFQLSRSISPAHVVILTDREIILLRDDDSQRWLRGSPHGAIWAYVPRQRIGSVTLGSRDNNMLSLSIDLRGDLRIESMFESSKADQLESLLQWLNM
jgi:hypothetical protein